MVLYEVDDSDSWIGLVIADLCWLYDHDCAEGLPDPKSDPAIALLAVKGHVS